MNIQTDLPTSINSTRVFVQARQWIQECLDDHTNCHKNTSNITLPTRLISVHQSSNGLSARLCDGHLLQNGTQYLTLSHCWGDDKFLTLNPENKHLFERSIPIEKLTKTFQDALLLTVNIGFQYIWIDSLCIIQGDLINADWENEAVKMCEVYRNATCNIAASGASNGAVGLFTDRNCHLFEPVKVRAKWPCAHLDCASNSEYVLYQEQDYWENMYKGPLFERAWV
jgi:hypothetical protein